METTNRREKRHGLSRLQRNLAATVLAFVALLSLASCGGGNEGGGNGGEEQAKGGNAGGGGGGTQMQEGGTTGAKPRPITDVRSIFLATGNEKSLNGSRVRLKDMEVRTLVSERAFYVGENDAERLLVIYVGDEQVQVSEGQKVMVTGALNQPRPQLEEKLALSEQEATAMNEQRIFLRAGRVQVPKG